MNPEAVLAVLPDSKEDVLSIKEIAHAMGLDISSHTEQIRMEKKLTRVLRTPIKWGWVAYDIRQSENGNRAWHNAYWKTELAKSA